MLLASLLLAPLFLAFYAASSAPPAGRAADTLFVLPAGWPKPRYNFSQNPLTPEGVALGRRLFYDPLLSADSTISCASCHLPATGFTHVDHALSHGIKGRKGTRNSPALVNLAWSGTFMWDGGVNHLDVQPLAPLQSEVEMNSSLNTVLLRLQQSGHYRRQFAAAFKHNPEINSQNFLKALAQFLLTVQSFNSKYDQVLRHEPGQSFTAAEARGLTLFRKHCNTCHSEPLFTNNSFENNGLPPDTILNDGGRVKITRRFSDSLKFKVPSLRNVEVTYPYMHDGRFRSLQMVLFHYSHGTQNTINQSDRLKTPLPLSEQDKGDLIAFLKTLTDEAFLHNPRYAYPRSE